MSNNTISLNFPVTGPWGSEQAKEAYKKALEAYEKHKGENPYVALVESHHEYTTGYWVEFEEKEVKYPDLLLKSNKSDTQLPAEVADLIKADAKIAFPCRVLLNEHTENVERYRIGYIAGATAYAIKLKEAQQEIESLTNQLKKQNEVQVAARGILVDILTFHTTHGIYALIDKEEIKKIKTFLDGK